MIFTGVTIYFLNYITVDLLKINVRVIFNKLSLNTFMANN